MLSKKTCRRFSLVTLLFFFLSLEGVRVLAQDILDSPTTQEGFSTTGTGGNTGTSSTSNPSTGTGDGTSTSNSNAGTEVAAEPLTVPKNEEECVLVEPFGRYNIPALEIAEGESWNRGPCGQFAMTSSMKGRGKNVRFVNVLKEMNPLNIFTVPVDLVRFAISKGFSCSQESHQSINRLLSEIRSTKRSVLCLVHASELEKSGDSYKIKKQNEPHWVNVVGFRLAKGEPKEIFLKDSYWANGSGKVKSMPVSEFDFLWKENVGIAKVMLDPKRLLLILGAADSADFFDHLSNYFTYMSAGEVLASSVTTGARALDAMYRGFIKLFTTGNPMELIRGANHLVSAATKLVGGLVGFVTVKIGEGISHAGRWLMDQGANLWKNGGILGKFVAIPFLVLGSALKIIGGVLQVVGNLVASVFESIGNLVEDIANAIADFFGAILDAINPLNWF
ncbi:hypothetical protein HYY75_00415 [bacterium]|nr:hypothetical protein [bacterium]